MVLKASGDGKTIYIKLHVKFVLAPIRHTLDLILNSELRSIFCPPSEAFYHIHTWIQPMCHLTRFYVILRTLTECHFNGWRALFLI